MRFVRFLADQKGLVRVGQVLLLVIGLVWVGNYRHDDAYITFRYVERLFAGQGLGWSSGGPVEGYSHPAWMLLLVSMRSLGVSPPTAARMLGIVAILAIPFTHPRHHKHNYILFLSCLSLSTLCWAVSGLETLAFAWCAWGACVAYAMPAASRSRAVLLPTFLTLVALLRPEGFAILLWVSLLELASIRAMRWPQARLVQLAAPYLINLGYLAFRWFYFRSLIANSALVKITDEPLSALFMRGVEDLSRAYPVYSPVLVGALALVVMVLVNPATRLRSLAVEDRGLVLAAVPSMAILLVILLRVGGDHMIPFGRMMVPVVVLLGGVVNTLGQRTMDGSRPLRMALAGLAVFSLVSALSSYKGIPAQDPAYAAGRWTGRFLEKHLPPQSLVATATAGSTPYFAPSLDFIDSLGLNCKEIATTPVRPGMTRWSSVPGHQRGNGRYILSRKPDVIILGPATGFLGNDRTKWFVSCYELLANPEFREQYTPFLFPITTPLEINFGRTDFHVPMETKLSVMDCKAPPEAVEAVRAGGGVLVAYLRNDRPSLDLLRGEGISAQNLLQPIHSLAYRPIRSRSQKFARQ